MVDQAKAGGVMRCLEYRPDHNGECLNCDEWWDEHMKKIGIVGSRRRDGIADYEKVLAAFNEIASSEDQIVSGGCPQGADRFAQLIAKAQGRTITIHYANWHKFGKGAGFVRNTLIAADADYLIACVAPDRTGGTEDTIKKFMNPVLGREPKGDLILV